MLKQDFVLIIDVYSSAKLVENSGIVRVTRRLSRELQSFIDLIIFVLWDEDENEYVLPTKEEYQRLANYNGPVIKEKEKFSQTNNKIYLTSLLKEFGDKMICLLFPEIILSKYAKKAIAYAKDRKMYTAAIFYDAIPILYPELCNTMIRKTHNNYMLLLSELDLIFPISQFSADCLKIFWEEYSIPFFPDILPVWLPGQFGNTKRNTETETQTKDTIQILCVSTLEPRKNHKNLMEAFLKVQNNHKEISCSLILIGNCYNGAPEIANYIKAICKENPNIQWLGIVDDDCLERLYLESDFTIYPSYIEGYGLPIMESLWKGKPCICHNQGVMSELAQAGGCLTVNVKDSEYLYNAIYQLTVDSKLRYQLSLEATQRKIQTWYKYAKTITSVLSNYIRQIKKLDCCIMIGLNEERLSLASRHSKVVFVIDKDFSNCKKLSYLKNISYLEGDTDAYLPILLEELKLENWQVDFIYN